MFKPMPDVAEANLEIKSIPNLSFLPAKLPRYDASCASIFNPHVSDEY
jgi:hypothetical protein